MALGDIARLVICAVFVLREISEAVINAPALNHFARAESLIAVDCSNCCNLGVKLELDFCAVFHFDDNHNILLFGINCNL